MSMGRVLPLLCAALLAGVAGETSAQQQRPSQPKSLFSAAPAATSGTVIQGMRPETVGAVARVSLAPNAASSLRALGGAPQQMQIALPDGNSVTCALRSQSRPGGMVLMRGAPVGGDAGDRCNLVVANGQVTGEINVASGRYQIVPLGGSEHAVVELNTDAFPNESEAEVLPEPQPQSQPQQLRPFEPPPAPLCDMKPRPGQQPKAFGPIRIMFVYTTAAKAETANIRAEIELMFNQTREAFSLEKTGGNFSVAVELAHVQDVNYQEVGQGTDLRRLTDPKDPIFRSIHNLRNQFRADVVHMLIKKQPNEGCGVGWLNLQMRADGAFSLSDRQCALGQFSALHEIAHTLGFAHDRYVIPPEKIQPGDFNFGFVSVEQGFRTVMSYGDQCLDQKKRCPRILQFSSPNIQIKGVSIGKPLSAPDAAYNLEQLCRNAPAATRFR
jgi:hypothetical protein